MTESPMTYLIFLCPGVSIITMGHQARATFEIRDSIGIVTIDNPPQNRLDDPVFIEPALIQRCSDDDGIKGLIFTGDGRHFSAGADMESLRRIAADESLFMARLQAGKALLESIEAISIPTIAAIEGACFGGGLEIALACHMRVCARNAILAFPEVNHGLMPGMGGTVRLPGFIGFGRALETVLSGDIIDAERALEIGLADHLAPSRKAMDFSIALMKKMVADRPIEVIRSIVQSLNNGRTMAVSEAMEEETKMFCRLAGKLHG